MQSPRLAPLTRVGRYEVVQALGVGSYATVFAAYDTELDRHVALKVFLAPYARMEVESEARALARVDHPNVIKLHEIVVADGLVFLVLELVRGWTLHDYISGWHDWRDIVGVFIQAAEGLAAIHRAGLVHGDIKPDNILIDRNGRVLIADLGRARTLDDLETGDGGAVTYMAPERLAGGHTSAAADQFGLCLMLWEALFAVRPWSMNSTEIVRSTEPERARWRSGVPRRLERVVRRGLAVTSRDRFENMDALAVALTRVLVDARRRELRRPIVMLTIAGALLILASALLVLHLTGRQA